MTTWSRRKSATGSATPRRELWVMRPFLFLLTLRRNCPVEGGLIRHRNRFCRRVDFGTPALSVGIGPSPRASRCRLNALMLLDDPGATLGSSPRNIHASTPRSAGKFGRLPHEEHCSCYQGHQVATNAPSPNRICVTDQAVGEARIASSFRVAEFSGKTRKEIGVNAAHRNNADPTIITIPLSPTELTSTAIFLHSSRRHPIR
jgi:hypothetical protein